MKKTGAQMILEILMEHGVDTVFGYPGGAALNVYDALYEYQDRIKHILTAHEQGASHAADGYARATGKTGVVFATSGPGATNLVTGIATAYMDSIPMVAITSNVADSLIGRDAFQEIYITGITMPITKHNFFVNRIEDLADAMREAFRIAQSGRKGPVLVDVTKDVTAAMIEYVPAKPLPLKEMPKATDEELKQVAAAINQAKCPVLYFGGGAASRQAEKELHALMETADIPAAHTMMAAGLVPHDDERSLGMIGMHGSVTANQALFHADMVLALGTRFSDRVALNIEKFSPGAVKIQVDIDPCEINKNVPVDQYIVGDVKDFLERLLPLIEQKEHPEWRARIAEWQEQQEKVAYRSESLHPGRLIRDVCDMTDKETVYVTDVGQHQMWAAQYVKHSKTRHFLTSGGLGTMGYGYGAAIGAQAAYPEKRVIHFTGDASFHMNMNEACTAVSQEMPIITIIFDNKVLGMVYQWQTAFYGRRYASTTPERKTDFAKVAEGFGAKGYHVSTEEDFKKAFAEALQEKGPVWITCDITRDLKVLPMIPNGGTVEDMILE
ncbi:biosynthetic-type acetolactate synthase large subunit [Anaerotignum sp.]